MTSNLYQINTRVWRHRFGANTKLRDIPEQYWTKLAQLGIDYVWLMGVWQTGPNVLNYAMEPGLQEEYSRILPDWTPQDIIGSPYAIDRYVLHKDLGQTEDLAALRVTLNKHGLKLILDFVPNHFHAETAILLENPEVFLEVSPPLLDIDSSTFYRSPAMPERVFAHGKDPYFAAWQDTIQVNYATKAAQQFMQEQLMEVAKVCDGVRCDMAMLPLPTVFRRTWEHALGMQAQHIEEFWPTAIQEVKNKHADFCFIAEVYWDMEWELQQQGFDFTYDKRLRDRLIQLDTSGIKGHLKAALAFQGRSVRFLENHDEDRIISELDAAQAQAAAIIAYLIPGLRFFYEGQWEGRQKRLPVQLGRMPEEYYTLPRYKQQEVTRLDKLPGFRTVNHPVTAFYNFLLLLLQYPVIKKGQWRMLATKSPGTIGFVWSHKEEVISIFVNYQQEKANLENINDNEKWYYFLPDRPPLSFPLTLAPFQWVVITNNKKKVS